MLAYMLTLSSTRTHAKCMHTKDTLAYTSPCEVCLDHAAHKPHEHCVSALQGTHATRHVPVRAHTQPCGAFVSRKGTGKKFLNLDPVCIFPLLTFIALNRSDRITSPRTVQGHRWCLEERHGTRSPDEPIAHVGLACCIDAGFATGRSGVERE